MTAKIRRVDLWPDDWLGGLVGLSLEARGVYLTACLLIYSRGGPIEPADLRDMCPRHARAFRPALGELIERGKLLALADGRLDQKRCQVELERARARADAQRNAANKRWHPNGGDGGDADKSQINRSYSVEKEQITETVSSENNDLLDAGHMPAKLSLKENPREESSLDSKGVLGCAWAPASAHAREGPAAPPSPEDVEYVGKIVGELLDVIALPPSAGLRAGTIRAPAAYQAAITATKRDTWLNNLAVFVGEALPTLGEQMAAWEAIEAARAAGSREATPPEVRQAVDRLSALREAAAPLAMAAE